MRLGETENATIIVRTIIGLAHNFGLSIVAEGVETAQQLAIVREFSCDQAQGFFLGRPSQLDGSTELMAARARLLVGGRSRSESRRAIDGSQDRGEAGLLAEVGTVHGVGGSGD